MKLDLTDRQLERIIKLLEKVRMTRDDEELIRYLEMYLELDRDFPARLDEIPF
jgi:hypothetical protein